MSEKNTQSIAKVIRLKEQIKDSIESLEHGEHVILTICKSPNCKKNQLFGYDDNDNRFIVEFQNSADTRKVGKLSKVLIQAKRNGTNSIFLFHIKDVSHNSKTPWKNGQRHEKNPFVYIPFSFIPNIDQKIPVRVNAL